MTGWKKLTAKTGNIVFGFPNKLYNSLANKLLDFNTKFETFERKQVFAQEINKAKQEIIKQTGQKMISMQEAIMREEDFSEQENKDNVSGRTWYDDKLKKRIISINPNMENQSSRGTKMSYNNGELASDKVKNSLFMHELVHWLNGKDLPEEYVSTVHRAIKFSDEQGSGRYAATKVSSYAYEDPEEFLAEYVSGRMDGHKYPKITNLLFERLWKGPHLTFPDEKNK